MSASGEVQGKVLEKEATNSIPGLTYGRVML